MATGSSGAALAESWNGSTWTVVPTPPVGGENSNLDSVSCTSASACTAVGNIVYEVGDGGQKEVPLAEQWNGTGWTRKATPKPSAGGATSLSSVSCTSASSCTAVGFNTGFVPEHWDGTRWAIQPSVPADAPSAVSCTSSTACTAVARGGNGSEALRWNGTGWVIQHTFAWPVQSVRRCVHIGLVVHCGRAARQPPPRRTGDPGRTVERGQMGLAANLGQPDSYAIQPADRGVVRIGGGMRGRRRARSG